MGYRMVSDFTRDVKHLLLFTSFCHEDIEVLKLTPRYSKLWFNIEAAIRSDDSGTELNVNDYKVSLINLRPAQTDVGTTTNIKYRH